MSKEGGEFDDRIDEGWLVVDVAEYYPTAIGRQNIQPVGVNIGERWG